MIVGPDIIAQEVSVNYRLGLVVPHIKNTLAIGMLIVLKVIIVKMNNAIMDQVQDQQDVLQIMIAKKVVDIFV